MSKYTRSNKINHFHDRGSNCSSTSPANINTNLGCPISNHGTSALIMSSGLRRHVRSCIAPAATHLRGTHCEHKLGHLKAHISSTSKSSPPTLLLTTIANCTMPTLGAKLGKMHFNSIAFIVFVSIVLNLCVFMPSNKNGLVESLNCYHCSSEGDPGCDEQFTSKANYSSPEATDCAKLIGREAKVCRKMIQYIEHRKVVIRSCGYIDEHNDSTRKPMCHKRSGTFAIMMDSCNCYTDLCNHSASLVPNLSVLLIASCATLMIYFVKRPTLELS